jgi:hypothetical protein
MEKDKTPFVGKSVATGAKPTYMREDGTHFGYHQDDEVNEMDSRRGDKSIMYRNVCIYIFPDDFVALTGKDLKRPNKARAEGKYFGYEELGLRRPLYKYIPDHKTKNVFNKATHLRLNNGKPEFRNGGDPSTPRQYANDWIPIYLPSENPNWKAGHEHIN